MQVQLHAVEFPLEERVRPLHYIGCSAEISCYFCDQNVKIKKL